MYATPCLCHTGSELRLRGTEKTRAKAINGKENKKETNHVIISCHFDKAVVCHVVIRDVICASHDTNQQQCHYLLSDCSYILLQRCSQVSCVRTLVVLMGLYWQCTGEAGHAMLQIWSTSARKGSVMSCLTNSKFGRSNRSCSIATQTPTPQAPKHHHRYETLTRVQLKCESRGTNRTNNKGTQREQHTHNMLRTKKQRGTRKGVNSKSECNQSKYEYK